jgi:hypothetical protein
VRTRPDHGAVEPGHRHGDQADGDGTGLCCLEERFVSIGAFRSLRASVTLEMVFALRCRCRSPEWSSGHWMQIRVGG